MNIVPFSLVLLVVSNMLYVRRFTSSLVSRQKGMRIGTAVYIRACSVQYVPPSVLLCPVCIVCVVHVCVCVCVCVCKMYIRTIHRPDTLTV